jgi:hypothetical protein
MLSQERIDLVRRMSLDERLQLLLQMMRDTTQDLFEGPLEIVDRRFELLRRENEERTRRLCEGLARA